MRDVHVSVEGPLNSRVAARLIDGDVWWRSVDLISALRATRQQALMEVADQIEGIERAAMPQLRRTGDQ